MAFSAEDQKLFEETHQSVSSLNSTGYDTIDEILRGLVGIYECTFPNRIRSYYVVGSYSNGTAVSTSDLDFHPIFSEGFKNNAERRLARQIGWLCDMISPVELGVHPLPYPSVPCRFNGLVIYGEDLREEAWAPSRDDFLRWTMCVDKMQELRQADRLTYPLSFPDPTGTFYGYDIREMQSLDGWRGKGTKDLIGLLYELIMPMVSLKTGRVMVDKSETFHLYQTEINDKWSALIKEAWEVCRMEWEYRIPSSEVDRMRLRGLCERTLAFENHYLMIYKAYWLKELPCLDDLEEQLNAINNLGLVVYPDDAVLSTLEMFARSDKIELQSAALAAMENIKSA